MFNVPNYNFVNLPNINFVQRADVSPNGRVAAAFGFRNYVQYILKGLRSMEALGLAKCRELDALPALSLQQANQYTRIRTRLSAIDVAKRFYEGQLSDLKNICDTYINEI